ncbi:MAG: RNA polymerase sigma factor [Chloroflexota bacterium]
MQTLTLDPATTYDRQALVAIYEQYNGELYRYAYRLLGDAALAEDCVSETFSRFLKAVKNGMEPVENLRAYLYRVAHNWVTDHYRRSPLPAEQLDEMHADPSGSPFQAVAHNLDVEKVRAALLRLPADQRQVIELRFLEDWSHEEVAAALEKSVEATRALQHRALNSLKRMLVETPSGKPAAGRS